MILGFLVLALMFIYMFGSLPNVDFNKYAVSNQKVSPHTIFAYLASSSGNYLGIQYLPLMSKDVENPRKTVPRAMVLTNIAKKNNKRATRHNQTRTQQQTLSPQKSGSVQTSKKTDDGKGSFGSSNRRGGPTRVSFAPDTKGSDFLNKEETPSNKIIDYISSSVKKLVEEDPLQKDLKIIQSGGLNANADSNQVSTSEAEV
eukprot:gene2589-2755_t